MGNEYLDLSSAYLYLTANITHPIENDKAEHVSNWVQRLFSQVDVSLNGKIASFSSNTYAYSAYIEPRLTFVNAYKKTFLTNSMWYKVTAGHINDLGGEHIGAPKRRNMTVEGQKVDMTGYIPDDMFRQTRLLSPGVTV